MDGKLIIKVRFGKDIRRIPIHNEDITYDELVLMMQRVFNNNMNAINRITIKYQDDDGDLVTINDNADLLYAISCNRTLKLILLVNEVIRDADLSDSIEIRRELQTIRNHLNSLIDSINNISQQTSYTGLLGREAVGERVGPDFDSVIKTQQDHRKNNSRIVPEESHGRAHSSTIAQPVAPASQTNNNNIIPASSGFNQLPSSQQTGSGVAYTNQPQLHQTPHNRQVLNETGGFPLPSSLPSSSHQTFHQSYAPD